MPRKKVLLRFYGDLQSLLPREKRGPCIAEGFDTSVSVKDLIEALGVPHTEVDLILIDGESVGFDRVLRGGERISVYPVFRSLDVGLLTRVRPQVAGERKFVLDTHLGRLAAYLRMLGFDTLYQNAYNDEELARISAAQARILLTRDRGLLKRSMVSLGYLVRQTHPREQLIEVLDRFNLAGSITPFVRCLHCNALLMPVAKESVIRRLPPRTRRSYDEFHLCGECGRIYWKGPHYGRMQALITRVVSKLAEDKREKNFPPLLPRP